MKRIMHAALRLIPHLSLILVLALALFLLFPTPAW
jgi:hypothetical protein